MDDRYDRVKNFIQNYIQKIVDFYRLTNLSLDIDVDLSKVLERMRYLANLHFEENFELSVDVEEFYRQFFACFLHVHQTLLSEESEENYQAYADALMYVYFTFLHGKNGNLGEARLNQILHREGFYLPKERLN